MVYDKNKSGDHRGQTKLGAIKNTLFLELLSD